MSTEISSKRLTKMTLASFVRTDTAILFLDKLCRLADLHYNASYDFDTGCKQVESYDAFEAT